MTAQTFNLINNFWTEFEKIKKTISHIGGFDGFCQCESEKVIEKMRNPTETRSFLIIGMLVDQAVNEINTRSLNGIYEDFRSVYTYPKLVAHVDGSECSSSWFCYPSHGYDKKVDWSNMERVGKIILPEIKRWLIDNYDIYEYENVKGSILASISSNFRPQPEGQRLTNLVKLVF